MTATSNFHHDSPMTYPYTDPPMNSAGSTFQGFGRHSMQQQQLTGSDKSLNPTRELVELVLV